MQCSSCRFENMPGVRTCGRCGSPVGINELPIDVHPPRAGAWQKRIRRWLPSVVLRPQTLVDQLAAARRHGRREPADAEPMSPAVLVRLVVPGWAHFYQHEPSQGRLFLVPYLALLLLSFILLGTSLGAMVLGLAFGVHVAACISALRLGGIEMRQTLRHTAAVAVGLVLGVYLPAGWLVSMVAWPAAVAMDSAPFQAGDVVLSSEVPYWFREPRPGDVVLYHQRASYISFDNGRQHGTVRVGPGERIDRILAGPGDEVSFDDGELRVNGEPCRWQPLNPERWRRPLQLQVPAGCFFILPTTGEPVPDNVPENVWPGLVRELTLISTGDIRGRAYVRSFPPQRLKWLY